jgi:CheY-like chemotaxis protein
MSILLIDDNKAALALMKKALNSAGYRDVMAVDSTSRAIEYLCEAGSEVKETNVDIILFDIMMDEMDGAAFCRKIREYKHLKDVPILIITACDGARGVGIIPNLPAKKQKVSYTERSRIVLHTDGLLEVLDVVPDDVCLISITIP